MMCLGLMLFGLIFVLPIFVGTTLHYDATQIFRTLIKRWNDYKEEYDELHGDGAYDRVYKMPQYESFEEEEYDEWEY
ncbi:MAG: hypothetical protein EB000_05155 [Alphaproteobacteria bacterium]|nr:hypothetical protein [Alphaproteobacteria bacterium]